jgi:hypothetical protein
MVELSKQIESLRQEMIAHFTRLELMEEQALHLLLQISQQIKQAETSLTNYLVHIRSQLTEMERRVLTGFREETLTRFSEQIGKAQLTIQNREDPSYTVKDKKELLSFFLDHAMEHAKKDSFTSSATTSISRGVEACGRADFAISIVPMAAKRLEVTHVPQFDVNPIEWARGVQAFMELQSSLEVNDDVLKGRAEKAWKSGKAMRESFAILCDEKNVRVAIQSYQKASESLRARLIQSLEEFEQTKLGHPPRVGRPVIPKARDWYSISRHTQHPVPCHYLVRGPLEANSFHVHWPLIEFEFDPIALAEKAKVISLAEVGRKALEYIPGNDRFAVPIGQRIFYKVLDRNKKEIANLTIADIKIYVPQSPRREFRQNIELRAYDFSCLPYVSIADQLQGREGSSCGPFPKDDVAVGGPRNRLSSFRQEINFINQFWEKTVVSQFDDSEQIDDWTKRLQDDPQVTAFNDVAAAFALYMTLVSWSVSDRLEDPWRSGISSQIMRSIGDVQISLKNLVRGISSEYVPFLTPVVPSNTQDSVPRTQEPRIFESVKESLASSADRRAREWKDTNTLLHYPTLINTVLSNHLRKSMETAEGIQRQVGKDNQEMPFLDRMMSKLSAHIACEMS